MHRIENLTKDDNQKHTIIYDDLDIELQLVYMSMVQSWTLNVRHGVKEIKGIRCALGVYLLKAYNFVFDLIFLDTDQLGIDPFRLEDFSDGRVELYFVTPKECETIRGYKLEME